MAATGATADPVSAALADLAEGDWEARIAAAETLGLLLGGRRWAPPRLIRATRDREELVRITAYEALRDIGDPRSAAAIRRGLRDRAPLVRSYAAVAFALVDPTRARRAIQRAVRDDRSTTARVGYADALFILGERDALDDLLRLLTSRAYRVRCAAANTIGNLSLTQVERAGARKAIDAALVVETTLAAREALTRARRDLRRT